MNFEYLKTFITVVDEDSFSRAAKQLFITQSSVSKRILKLEDEIGTPLIIRDKQTSHVILTIAGQTLYRESLPYIKGMKYIEKNMQEIINGTAGKLEVCNFIFYYAEIFGICHDFSRAYPDVQLSISSHSLETIFQNIKTGLADFGFIFSTYYSQIDFESEKLTVAQDEYVAFFPKNHPCSEKSSISPKELRHENLICGPDSPFDFIQSAKLTPARKCNMPPDSLIFTVLESEGYSIAPRMALTAMKNSITILDIEDLDTTCNIYLIWDKNNPNPLIRPFVEIAKKYEARLESE